MSNAIRPLGHAYSQPWTTPRRGAFGLAILVIALVAPPLGADPLLRDPTQPPAAIQVAAAPEEADRSVPLALQAIIFADGRRVAIINDRRVQDGDTIQAARVVAIEPDRVRLERGSEELELHLVPTDIKQKTTTVPTAPNRFIDGTESLAEERGTRP